MARQINEKCNYCDELATNEMLMEVGSCGRCRSPLFADAFILDDLPHKPRVTRLPLCGNYRNCIDENCYWMYLPEAKCIVVEDECSQCGCKVVDECAVHFRKIGSKTFYAGSHVQYRMKTLLILFVTGKKGKKNKK